MFAYLTSGNKIYIIKNIYDSTNKKPRLQILFAKDYLSKNVGDFQNDIKTTGLDNEGGILFKNGKKTLKLIKRLISLKNKNSTILDFFAGFRVIIVIEANSYVNIKSSRLLPKFKTQKINSWCAAQSNHFDNVDAKQKEIIRLCKKLKQVEMENDILKQAALLLGKKQTSLSRTEINIALVQCVDYLGSQEVQSIII